MIRLLQISDIHFHSFSGDGEDDYANMRERLFDDLDYVRENLGPIDTVLICGDIAFSGKKDEYDIAKDFIKRTLVKLTAGGVEPKVFMVPGNHDKDRGYYEETRYLLNKALLTEKQQEGNSFFNKIRSKEEETLKILYSPFAEYNNVASIYSSADQVAESMIGGQSVKDKRVYCQRTIKQLGEYTVSLIGLNSALCCDQYDFSIKEPEKSHSLFLPKVAYNQVIHKNEIFVSVMHHPLKDFILHGDKIQHKFDNLYKVQLFGHIHKQSSFVDNAIKIYSGAFQPDEQDEQEYFPVYNIISLDVEGSNLKVAIKSRKWDGTKFVNYTDGSVTQNISLEPIDTWSDTDKENAEVQKQEAENMDKRYKVQKLFMDCSERKRDSIMKEYSFVSDKSKNEIAKAVLFLRKVEQDGKLDELEQKIAQYGRSV